MEAKVQIFLDIGKELEMSGVLIYSDILWRIQKIQF
jgi:hypothetical protein